MENKVVVAGATGHLGHLIVENLKKNGTKVSALVRAETNKSKLAILEKLGLEIIKINQWDVSELRKACEGAFSVISALAGLKDVIIDSQTALVDGAVSAGVQHFIPSDFAIDFTKFAKGSNRNLDLRREFHGRLKSRPIKSTSIYNGAFTEILKYPGLIDFQGKRVNYWENADQPMDFTTMENTAEYTAKVAVDPDVPKSLTIAGDQITARQLADLLSDINQTKFELIRLGSLEDLASLITKERTSDPEGEKTLYPKWQSMQYLYNMFSKREQVPLDNRRYPSIHWKSVKDFLSA